MIQEAHPDVYVTVGMVDDGLTSTGIVLPGLGDCGDRLFGTQQAPQDGEENGDNDLVVPADKRKRSNSVEAMEAMKKMKDSAEGM
jgi:Uracil phosphoribosyltransferase